MDPTTIDGLIFDAAKKEADVDPYSYVWKFEYHKNPAFKEITNFMITDLIEKRPELFFDFNFDRAFPKWSSVAADRLINSDPVYYVLGFGLHKRKGLEKMLPILFQKLSSVLGFSGGEEFKLKINPKSELHRAVMLVVEKIAKTDPEYYVSSGLAEDEEFGKFFGYVGKQAYVVCELSKISNKLDADKKISLANIIDKIIGV